MHEARQLTLDEAGVLRSGNILVADLSSPSPIDSYELTKFASVLGLSHGTSDEVARHLQAAQTLWRKGERALAALRIDVSQSNRKSIIKFDDSQARVPSGQAGGGQWTSQQAEIVPRAKGGNAERAEDVSPTTINLDCEIQYKVDSLLCRALKSRACWAQAAERYSACLVGRPLPPLNF